MSQNYLDALDDFHRARRKAQVGAVLAALRHKPYQLLSFEDVRKKLGAIQYGRRELQDIPLDAIIGSVNRYADFTRDFLPRATVKPSRWAGVMGASTGVRAGLDPIEVYQIGDVYFVSDGNHRVSIARQMGSPTIQAYVTEVKSRVQLTPDITPDEIILKVEYASFLERTHIDHLRPEADLQVTVPGGVQTLIEHIAVHHYYMGLDKKRDIPYEESVTDWYDAVYLPVVNIIRQKGLAYDFPKKTEADLYLWLMEYRSNLEHETGSRIHTEQAAGYLATYQSTRPQRLLSRLRASLTDLLVPDFFVPGPPPGEWRKEKAEQDEQNLFINLLVPLNGRESGWYALEQALVIARREASQLQGLHVITSKSRLDDPKIEAIRERFNRRCKEAGRPGSLAVVRGHVARVISNRAVWSDLVVVNLDYPPKPTPVSKLSSGFRTLVLRSPRPILVVPQRVSEIRSALLAYDGSPKAQEALYVAAYLTGQWQIPLSVLTVSKDHTDCSADIEQARSYLATYNLKVNYICDHGPLAQVILLTAEAQDCDLIIMGGYGDSPLVNFLLESVVDQVMLRSRKPMLLCR
jgi:hypothetical protein